MHLLLYVAVNNNVEKINLHKTPHVNPIKSYLFTPVEIKKENQQEMPNKSNPTNEPQLQNSVANTLNSKASTTENSSKTTESKITESKTILPTVKPVAKKEINPAPETKISKNQLYDQLKQINKQKIQQHIAQQVAEYSRKKSGSVLHGKPSLAPKSVLKPSSEQYRQQNTTRYDDDLSIKKNINGTCTVTRDLSTVGIEGVAALSIMACGESKNDRNFRHHMNKVLTKLGKK